MSFSIRPATPADADYIVHINQQIEGADAKLTKERLLADVLVDNPKAYAAIFEDQQKAVGLVFYAFCYWASVGQIMWVSQLYIDAEQRGKFFWDVKKWLRQKQYDHQCQRICWATAKDDSKDRTQRLWSKIGAKNLSQGFDFWVLKS